ncbi:MAG: transposase [Elusimicrobia bacterium]|nr:transposase [Elusimicrobiota bacterium]
MPRRPRIDHKGGLYHIINKGVKGGNICQDETDYLKILEYLRTTQRSYPFKCYGYVILPDHFHILMERLNDPLSCIMKSFLLKYVLYFNRKYSRKGHVFQDRYKAVLCQKEHYLRKLVRYIHMDPVRDGLVEEAFQWKWSSLNVYMGMNSAVSVDTDTVLDNAHKRLADAGQDIAGLSGPDDSQRLKYEIYPPLEFPVIGDDNFIRKISAICRMAHGRKPRKRIPLSRLAGIIAGICSIKEKRITGSARSRDVSYARAVLGYTAHLYYDYKITDIARYINKDPSTVTHAINRLKYAGKECDIAGILRAVKSRLNKALR